MELISYGGVEFKVAHTNSVVRAPVYEESGNAYLYTKWDIDVICIFNPAAIGTSVGPDLLPQANLLPGITWNNVANLLRTPRQRLTIRAGGVTILDVPSLAPFQPEGGQRYPCDAKNGPYCDIVGINQIVGVMHFLVHLKFTAHVNECTATHPVLANSWTVTENIDDKQYPTRITEGLAILRADAMRFHHENADAYRSVFFFPVPDNFQRTGVSVKMNEDGTQLRYTVTDVAQCKNKGAGSQFQKIDCYHTGQFEVGSVGRAALQAARRYAVEAAANPLTTAASAIVTLGFSELLRGGGHGVVTILDNLPKWHYHCYFEGWGYRDADDGFMFRTAIGTCFSVVMGRPELTNVGGIFLALVGASEIKITQGLSEKHIICELTITVGQEAAGAFTALTLGPLTNAALVAMTNKFNQNRPVVECFRYPFGGGDVQATVLDQRPGATNGNPVLSDNGTRAFSPAFNSVQNSLTTFITQLLLAPCSTPQAPDNRFRPPILRS